MKRLLAFLALTALAHAAGTVQTSVQPLSYDQQQRVTTAVIAWNWTGDAANGTVPSTAVPLAQYTGYFVVSVEFDPGTPSPTNNYSATITDPGGFDILGGGANALSSVNTQAFAPSTAAPPIQGTLTLNISGQAIANAKGTVFAFIIRPGTVNTAKLLNPGTGGGTGAVASVFNRTGVVTAQTGDYTAAQVTNAGQINAPNSWTAANTWIGAKTDFSAATHSLPSRVDTTANITASTCTIGEMAFANDATAGQNWYYCTALNVWTQQLNTGSGSGNGNAPATHSQAFSTTPTWACASSTKGNVDTFKFTSAMSANITSSTLTLANCTPGQGFKFIFTMDAIGSRTVVMPTGFPTCTLSPVPNKDTTCTYYWDGTTVWKEVDNGDDTPTIFDQMAERGAPSVSPGLGIAACWTDSGHKGFRCLANGSITAYGMISDAGLRRTCVIDNDTQSATVMTAVQFSGRCVVPAAATIVEVDLSGGTGTLNGTAANLSYSGTSSVQIGKCAPNGGACNNSLLSALVATTSGTACVLPSAAGTCINGKTSVSATISTTALNAGDELYISAATADGVQTWYNITIIYTIG